MKLDELFTIIKTKSSKMNELIGKKIESFENIDNFLTYYSDKKSNDLLFIIDKLNDVNLSEKEDNSKPDLIVEKYIYNLIRAILSVKIITKIEKILENILITSKKNLIKLKLENHIQNHNQKKLLLLIDQILNNSKIKKSKNFSNVSMLKKRFSSEEDISNNFFSKFSLEKKITKSNADPISTPKFKHEREDSIKNKCYSFKNQEATLKLFRPFKKKESTLTLSELILDEEPIRQINSTKQKDTIKNEANLDDKSPFKLEKLDEKKNVSLSERNRSKINTYKNLLEMIANLYKKGLINAEEKIKLKQLVIKKPENLENFYKNNYKYLNINNDILTIEIEKIIER